VTKSFTRCLPILLMVALAGCALRPPKVFRPEPPAIVSIGYSLDEYRTEEKAYSDAIRAGDLAGAKSARDRAAWGLLFVVNNNYQAYAQGLAALRSSAGLGADALQSGLAAGSNIFTNPATKNLLSATLLGVKGITGSVQSRYYLDVSPEVIILAMRANREPYLAAVKAGLDQDAAHYSLNQARSDLTELFWAGTLEGARVKLTEQAGKAVQEQQK
jgi:hypothetical protein